MVFEKDSYLRHSSSTGSMSAQVDECLLGLKAEKHLDRERALRKFQELISQSGELFTWPAQAQVQFLQSSLA
jgi:hypothetical protein